MISQAFVHCHLLGIEQLSVADINTILDKAECYFELGRKPNKDCAILAGRSVINLFFENSTRTLISFEIAAKRMGAHVINIHTASSSLKKGESILDIAMTLNSMNPDFVVIRHSESGAVNLLTSKVRYSVINGGDGCHEHPTQSLLDALTIRQKCRRIENLNIAICGDIIHSRVARSNILLLTKLGDNVRLIAPATLLPKKTDIKGVEFFTSMEIGLKNCNVIMMLRIQQERMRSSFIPSLSEFSYFYGLDSKKLSYANPDVVVMHPGPINRGVEIDSNLADNLKYSAVLDQIELGVAVRQAIFELLLIKI